MNQVIPAYPLRTVALLALPLIAACSTTAHTPQVVTGQGNIVGANVSTAVASVERGGSCAVNPCQVLFRTPPGEGDIRIVANGFDLGTFPRGETVSLGSYTESVRISLPGTDYGWVFVNIASANSR